MREARGNEKLGPVRRADALGNMLTIGRRALAQIDGDIENGAAHDAHELVLRDRRNLEMQAAHDAAHGRERVVVLHELAVDARFLGEHAAAERLQEEAARIGIAPHLQEHHIRNLHPLDDHDFPPAQPAMATRARDEARAPRARRSVLRDGDIETSSCSKPDPRSAPHQR